MLQRYDIQLRSIIKSLTDTVLPAIDSQNSLAQEQFKLSLGLLSMMQEQIPLNHDFDFDDLCRMTDIAEQLMALELDIDTSELRTLASSAHKLISVYQDFSPDFLNETTQQLRHLLSQVTEIACTGSNASRQEAVKKIVLSTSKEELIRDRTWVIAQGWESDSESLPNIRTLLRNQVSDT